MKAIKQDRQTIEQESRKLYRNLSRRIKAIQSQETPVADYAVKDFRELQEKYPRKLADMNDKQLREYYRDLRYISGLKTSTVKGALEAAKTFNPIVEKLRVFSPKTEDKFWKIYGKLFENNALLEKFKYEVFESIQTQLYGGLDVDDIIQNIEEAYQEAQEEGANADEQSILFTSKLDDIWNEYF